MRRVLAHAVPAYNGVGHHQRQLAKRSDVNGGLLGFSDPNGCQITTLNWTGGCGTGPGSSLKCPFGASTVHVSASNNGVSFTDAHDVKITVTNFGLGASPASNTVTAGTAASYAVTVTAQGGPFTGPVTLGCANLPAQASCTFNPAVVTPGASSATAVRRRHGDGAPWRSSRGHGCSARVYHAAARLHSSRALRRGPRSRLDSRRSSGPSLCVACF